METLALRKSIARSPLRLFIIPLVLGCFALSPTTRAVVPAPDGGYQGDNTAEGENALFSNTTGSNNTAIGFHALFSNITSDLNTATGSHALEANTEGNRNTATGSRALEANTNGVNNTANGSFALSRNTTGELNNQKGSGALFGNTTGSNNTASGFDALNSNTEGSNNTALGVGALRGNTTGGKNIAVGYVAGKNLRTGSNNIDIGNAGVAADVNTIEALSQLILTEITVRRDGQRRRISSQRLVPGDIVLIESGDRVPADLRLTSVRNLQIDESSLTGESVPVHKHCDPLALETILADRRNLAFAGTLATVGQGEGVVWATGDKTEAGRIRRR